MANRGEQARLKRLARWEGLFRSGDLFAAGLIMMIAFLLNPSTILKIPQFLLFWFYAWLSGRKSRPLAALTIMLGIVFFNLLTPYGRILAEAGAFRVTQGSLLLGIRKALTLEGLFMLSGAVIRRDLKLPGTLGALIGESFRLFYLIPQRKGLITRQDPIGGIDRLILELDAEQEAPESGEAGEPLGSGRPSRRILLAAMVLPALALSLLPEAVFLSLIAGFW